MQLSGKSDLSERAHLGIIQAYIATNKLKKAQAELDIFTRTCNQKDKHSSSLHTIQVNLSSKQHTRPKGWTALEIVGGVVLGLITLKVLSGILALGAATSARH
jgi:hypothetical protein